MRARYVTLLLAAVLLASGCGGDDDASKADTSTTAAAPAATTTTSPETSSTDPAATVRVYFKALAGGDGAKACSLLTAKARRKALATERASKKKRFKNCAQALTAIGASTDSTGEVQITKSAVDGDRAKVAVRLGASDFDLLRLGGRWYIAGPFR